MESESALDVELLRSTVFLAGIRENWAAQMQRVIEHLGSFETRIVRNVETSSTGIFSVGCGVVLLDVDAPGAGQLAARLRAMPISLPIIALTASNDYEIVVEAFRAGAIDVLEAPLADRTLLDRLERAIREDRQRAPHRVLFWRVRELVSSLTPRERQVMRCVVDGRANKQIAAELGISEKTVEVHRHKVMRKMEADSLAALVRMSVVMETSAVLPARSLPSMRRDMDRWRPDFSLHTVQ